MIVRADLIVSFGSGMVLGVVFAFLGFKARLRFYRKFIEDRLAPVNQLLSSEARSHGGHESSL